MVKAIQPNWDRLVKHPTIIVILGAKRSGKTGLACVLLEHFHNQKLPCYVIGGRNIKKAFPSWVKNVTPKYLNFKPNSVNLGDDIHLYAYAREWFAEPNKVLDKFNRESAHGDRTFIYTTQQSISIDKNLLSMCDVLFIKRPSLLQTAFARKEIAKTMEFVEKCYKELEAKSTQVDLRKWTYALTHEGEYMIGEYDLPTWYNDSISKIYRDTSFRTKRLDDLIKAY